MFKRVLNTSFDWIWWIGFGGAVLIVIVIIMGIIDNTLIVLSYGIIHMILLSFLGGTVIAKRGGNIDIGHRISTMGYLHTLIGTSVALILASNHNTESQNILNQMDSIIVPIGSALITSIIGWAVGTEMERSVHGTKEETIVDNALGNLEENINNLGKELEKSTQRWSDIINETIENLTTSTQDLEIRYQKALLLSSSKLDNDSKILMDKYFSSFENVFNQVGKQVTIIQKKFDKSSDDATKVMSNLMIAFESIFKRMNDQATGIEKNFKLSSDSANKVIEDLSLSYKKLLTQTKNNVDRIETNLNKSGDSADEAIERFIKSFESLFNTMQTYSNRMEKDFEKSTKNAKEIMDELTLSFTKVFGQIGKISTGWEKHITNMENFSNNSSSSLNSLLHESKRITREIKDVADGMPNSVQILREVDSILEILRVIKENDTP